MNDDLIYALAQHAIFITRCTQAQMKIAAMTAENMQRAAVGSSMAYSDDMFEAIDIPDENAVVIVFTRK